jgi:hypothetical protein
VVTRAVVPTVTVTGCAAPALPLICTEELDKVQVGASLTVGLTRIIHEE